VRDQLQVTFRINGERLALLGWSRAILLQLAHPLIAAGVFDHSGFRSSPMAAVSRLYHTTQAMLAITFGDARRQAGAIAGIRQIHTRVNGTLPMAVGPFPAGTPYSAEDPALLLWVHATLLESMVITYEQLVGPLPPDERDRYCAESLPPSVALGMRDADAPRSWHDLQAYLQQQESSGTIVVGPQARQLADAILRTSIPAVLAPARAISGLITAALLPPRIRQEYGLPWSEDRQRRFERVASLTRRLRAVTPAALALFADARARRRP
jgi:uncharacterized protein (DUF2236 family)